MGIEMLENCECKAYQTNGTKPEINLNRQQAYVHTYLHDARHTKQTAKNLKLPCAVDEHKHMCTIHAYTD